MPSQQWRPLLARHGGETSTLELGEEHPRRPAPPTDEPRLTLDTSHPKRRGRTAALTAGACAAAILAAAPALAAPATPSTAQAAAAPKPAPAKPSTVSELVVTAEHRVEPGEVVGDIKPDLQLAPEDVQA